MMDGVKELLVILIGSSLVSNVVLSQFLGLCPFLGVSRKTNTAAGMGAALLVRGEYVFLGVLAAVLVYLLRDRGRLRVLGLAPLLIVSPWTALAVPVLLLYNGQRGKGNKWFFYVFYPAHFLVFAALAAVITG